MYELRPRMLQRLKGDLTKYHTLFSGGCCSGWELEELVVVAVKADTQVHHHVIWKESGHDAKADMIIKTNGDTHAIQIKSGQVIRPDLILSGNLHGKFEGNLDKITESLNTPTANIIAVLYRKVEGEHGRQHIYRVAYIEREIMTGLTASGWTEHGKQFIQTNEAGVKFSLCPSMSWQIWWRIPTYHVDAKMEFTIE